MKIYLPGSLGKDLVQLFELELILLQRNLEQGTRMTLWDMMAMVSCLGCFELRILYKKANDTYYAKRDSGT